jgi:hypothetical protein
MRIRLVKHIIDSEAEAVHSVLYRDLEIPFIPYSGLILQKGPLSEYIQCVGYHMDRNRFEALVYPWFVESDSSGSGKDLVKRAMDEGWTVDRGGNVMVDFAGKLDEEQAVRDYLEADNEVNEDPDGVELEPWREEHDKLYPDQGLGEEEVK